MVKFEIFENNFSKGLFYIWDTVPYGESFSIHSSQPKVQLILHQYELRIRYYRVHLQPWQNTAGRYKLQNLQDRYSKWLHWKNREKKLVLLPKWRIKWWEKILDWKAKSEHFKIGHTQNCNYFFSIFWFSLPESVEW